MKMLGGSIFVRNAIEYDYCICEAVDSLVATCDEVVVMDCCSDDGTVGMLTQRYKDNKKVRLVFGQTWEIGVGYDRLRQLANIAKSYLNTKWHFMLQADEVIHEDCIPFIRSLINTDVIYDKYIIRRYNLWGSFNHMISLHSPRKPVSDGCCRLALTKYDAVGDAESIDPSGATFAYIDNIRITHYGFVRKGAQLINKIINMQEWFHQGVEHIDKRVIAQKETGKFDSVQFFGSDDLIYFPDAHHPTFAKKWVDERRDDPTYIKYIA